MIKIIPVAPGVTLRAMKTDKFKTACFSVNFLRPHEAQTAALDALLPSVLLRGTEKYPDIRSISMRMDELYGASFGTLIRRKGEIKLMGFYADFIEEEFLPQGETVFESMVDFLEEVVYHPLTEEGSFCQRNVEGEKQNLVNAIASSMNDKRSYSVSKMLQIMCDGEAYGIPRLGRVEDVKAITPDSLWEHYQRVLRTSRVELYYAGRKEPEQVAEAFARVFDGKVRENPAPAATRVIRSVEKMKEVSEAMNVTQGKLVMGLRTGITVEDPDYPALVLLNGVFGGGPTSKLFANVREKLSLCYYASASVEKYKGIMVVSSGVDFENFQKAKEAILGELDDCKKGKISREELETARRLVLSGLRASLDAPVQLDEYYMGAAIAKVDSIPELMEKISLTTLEEVIGAAQKLAVDTIFFLKGEQ